ncbi:MAG: hypothetical protein HC903_20575 [Methylacidiphilales bacterium]|nr:hypothetical protein [Candidatus Methylacidiphilales bacterium]NJR14263.1 hypothetical protein [Calothrix sp. CSU_2_0]
MGYAFGIKLAKLCWGIHLPARFRRLSRYDYKELAPGLLRSLIAKAGLTVEEFLENK